MVKDVAEVEDFDVVVVGGGPAGLNTAIMCATRHLKVLLLEGGKLGGLLTTLYPNKTIPNYPGFPEGVVAIELVRNWLQHVRASGVTMRQETVLRIAEDLTVTTDKGQHRSRVMVLATGTRPRRLGLPNESKFSKEGRGVYYFPSHPEDFLGKKVLIVGGGDTAIDAAVELLNLANEITVVHRGDVFRAFDENVEKVRRSGVVDVMLKAEVTALKGRNRIEQVLLRQGGNQRLKRVDSVVIAVGLVPNTELVKDLGLKRDRDGFIWTDRGQRTNVEGLFAVGDVTHTGLRLVTVAAAHGAIASHHIYSFVRRPYWAREGWPMHA